MCVLGARAWGVRAVRRGSGGKHLKMPLTLLKKHLQALFVCSYGKWFYKVLGRIISLKFSLDFNDLRIIQNFFQNTKRKGVWSSLEFPHCFSGQITPLDSAGHPRGDVLPSSHWRTLLPPLPSIIWGNYILHLVSTHVSAPLHVLFSAALISLVRCGTASAQVFLTALWKLSL